MDSTFLIVYFYLIVMFFIILPSSKRNKKLKIIATRFIRNKNSKGDSKMKEVAKQFLGKKCDIMTISSDCNVHGGVINDIVENSIVVETKYEVSSINLEYIIKITEVKVKQKKAQA